MIYYWNNLIANFGVWLESRVITDHLWLESRVITDNLWLVVYDHWHAH